LVLNLYFSFFFLFKIDEWGKVELPWQLTWLLQAIWELLNYVVLAAIAIATRPHGEKTSERELLFVD
jgi:uncharacterized membrane protein SirB2